MTKEKILLHCCCAPCATVPWERLQKEYNVQLYFYNPNIQPYEEYLQRLNELKKFTKKSSMTMIEGEYDVGNWEMLCKDLAIEPEGGKRCGRCYEIRLVNTAKQAKKMNIPWFTSTLSISPHKNAEIINMMGEEIAQKFGLKFYAADFKKRDGFKQSIKISKQEGFYRQNYCGCIYSKQK